MIEVFKPRENMVYNKPAKRWECRNGRGNLVCDGGPSVIWDDDSWSFYISEIGRHHRLDGPATSRGNWYFHGKVKNQEIRDFAKENGIDLGNLTDADKVMIALRFG